MIQMKAFIKEYKYIILSFICVVLFFVFSGDFAKDSEEVIYDNYTFSHAYKQSTIQEKLSQPPLQPTHAVHHSEVKRIKIKDKGIDQEVIPVGVDEYGRVATADNAVDLTWYARTGENITNIIIAGHRDYTDGIGVLSGSENWEKGLQLKLEFVNGEKEVFELTHKYNYTPKETPSDIMNTETGEYRVTLITCGGDFIRGYGYEERIYNIFSFSHKL